jgi:hypothetical protein
MVRKEKKSVKQQQEQQEKEKEKEKEKENEQRSPPLLYAYQSALARLSPERDRWDFHRRNRH